MITKTQCRNLFAVLITVLVATTLFAAEKPTSVRVISDDGVQTIVEMRLNDYTLHPVVIEGQEYVQVSLPGAALELEEGVPSLPHLARSLIVSDNSSVQITVLSLSYHDVVARVAPSKGNLHWGDDPRNIPYRFSSVYQKDALYPASIATLGEPYIQRDLRAVTLSVHPFRYNPVQGVLRVYDSITVAVKSTGTGSANLIKRANSTHGPVRAFEEIYRHHFINYNERNHGDKKSGTDYPDVREEGDLLIIAHDPWLSNLDPLVQHKRQKGFTVSIVGVSTIGNTWEQIKQYIQDYYNSHNLAFVLLVGDAEHVATPPRQVEHENGAADPIYSKLAGNDDYPDILVGRFSARSDADVDTQVKRSVEHDTLSATSQGWYQRAAGIASRDAGPGVGDDDQTGIEHIAEIRTWLLADHWDPVDEIYEPSGTTQDITNALNPGRGVANYCGHGSPEGWASVPFSRSDVNHLENRDKLPFIFSVSCNIGEFHHYDTCFTEVWLQAQKEGHPTGAAGIYGSSVSQYMAPPMEAQDEFNKLLTDAEHPFSTFGGLCFSGSDSMMDAYGQDGVDMFDTWILFGDPSLNVIEPRPKTGLKVTPRGGLISSGPVGGAFSPTSRNYTLENRDASPLSFEVTDDKDWISVSPTQGEIPAGDTTTVTVSINENAQDLDFCNEEGTVFFKNLTNGDGDTTRLVQLTVGNAVILQRWALDTDPGWQCEGDWAYGQPTGSGGGGSLGPDPTSAATGTKVYGVNLQGNITTPSGPSYYLTSGAVDLTDFSDTELAFERWLNAENPWSVDSMVEVSNDGQDWTTIWQAQDEISEESWSHQSYSISSVADGQQQVYLRWGYGVHGGGGGQTSGWNIDDIAVNGRLSTAKIALTVTKTELSWAALRGAVSYDVVRGDLGGLRSSAGDFRTSTEACVANDVTGTSVAHSGAPAAGTGHWYLVRGTTLSGPLTYQSLAFSQEGARDAEINESPASCQ